MEPIIDSKVMEDENSCNPLQEKIVKDAMNGELKEQEEQALLFLDSLDGYLILLDSLTTTLRQGWLELASARHSMGSSRVSSTLFDLKVQSAATTVMVNEPVVESPSVLQPQSFRLSKWACLEERESSPNKLVDGSLLFEDRKSSKLRHRGPKHVYGTSVSAAVDENLTALSLSENSSTTSESTADENKKRYKSLSVFGALVSPKLRAAQVSFETGVELDLLRTSMRLCILVGAFWWLGGRLLLLLVHGRWFEQLWTLRLLAEFFRPGVVLFRVPVGANYQSFGSQGAMLGDKALGSVWSS